MLPLRAAFSIRNCGNSSQALGKVAGNGYTICHMRKLAWNLSRIVLVTTLFSSAAHATDAVQGGVAEPYAREASLDATARSPLPALDWIDGRSSDLKTWLDDKNLQIGAGFSAAYLWNANDPRNGKNTLHPLAEQADTAAFELLQLTFGINSVPDRSEFGLGVQLDIGSFARRIKADWNGTGYIPDNAWEPSDIEFQQIWVAYHAPIGKGLLIRAGRLTTLLGAEVIEPWNNRNFSRSFLFGYAIPQTHTGAYATLQVTDMIALTGGAVVGWNSVQDNNASASATGQLAIRPNEKFRLYINGIIGPEQTCAPNRGALPPLSGAGCNANKRGVLDMVIGMTPLPGLDFTLNYDFGSETAASQIQPGRHASWVGFSGVASYTKGRWQTALRGEWFQDQQGARTGTAQTLWALTLDGRIRLSQALYLRAEYRHDESNQAVFTGNSSGRFLRAQDTIALELGYSL